MSGTYLQQAWPGLRLQIRLNRAVTPTKSEHYEGILRVLLWQLLCECNRIALSFRTAFGQGCFLDMAKLSFVGQVPGRIVRYCHKVGQRNLWPHDVSVNLPKQALRRLSSEDPMSNVSTIV